MKVFKKAYSLKGFDNMLETFKQKRPSLFEVGLENVSEKLFLKYQKIFPWHHSDTINNFQNPVSRTDDAITYYERILSHFDIDQILHVKRNMNKIICTWDPNRDLRAQHIPCLITLKFIRNGKQLDVVATWRNRDILRRMIGNWEQLRIIAQQMCKGTRMNPGTLYDFNMQAFFHEEDLRKWRKI